MTSATRRSFGVLLLSACAAQCAPAPTQPTTATSLAISNLRATEIGLPQNVCGMFEYAAWDRLLVDYAGVSESELVGATMYQNAGGTRNSLGVVALCPETTSPCDFNPKVCIINSTTDRRGTVRAFARAPWIPEQAWNLSIEKGTITSNLVSTTISRTDGLPHGDRAGIVYLNVLRIHSQAVSFSFLMYSPQVAGRSIRKTIEVFSNGVRLLNLVSTEAESSRSQIVGSGGGLPSVDGTVEYDFTCEEIDATGQTLVLERRVVFVH